MKKTNFIIIALSFLILGSLVMWQINNLNESYRVKVELDKAEMQNVLLESAIEIKKTENIDSTFRTNSTKLKHLTDSILVKNFKSFDYSVDWGYYNGLNQPFHEFIKDETSVELANSNLRVCTSCLLSIGIVPSEEEFTKEEYEKSGYVIDHTPAQMRDVMGLDKSKLKYLHIYPSSKKGGFYGYLLPIAFLIGLSSLFIWLIYLNHKQSKLILQKNEFVNHLSHQFQTPLSSIKLSANLLASKKIENRNELIGIIQTESKRLENHIKTVLHWVKSDADRLHILKENLSITDVIEKSLRQMKPVFLTNKTTINFVPPDLDFTIFADLNHVQLMLFNIWENAIKHNEKPIELNIRCVKNDRSFIIQTSDNGIGLQKNAVPEKFKGLGLAYVNKIMKEHNGNMMLSSKNNEGLSVQLNFPVKND